eukprot:3778198-Pyramimonas_sp.AAC.1
MAPREACPSRCACAAAPPPRARGSPGGKLRPNRDIAQEHSGISARASRRPRGSNQTAHRVSSADRHKE